MVKINTATSATATFTDADTADTHTASWNWGDGKTSIGIVTESNGSGNVSNAHTYTAQGIYTITLTVTDNKGASGSAAYQYVKVYDSTPGHVFAGGGIYTSQAGWDSANPNVSGLAVLTINAQYAGGSTPVGATTMTFAAGNLNFRSTGYNWLVRSGGVATLQGTGTINGTGNYTCLLSGVSGTGASAKFRLQIIDASGHVIYDTQAGSPITATPTASLSSGSIIIN